MTGRGEKRDDCPEMDYFMDESLSDVVFIIEGQRLPADKHFLSIRNRVFRAMFSDKFKESKDKEVVIEDTTFDAFKTLIEFLYTDQLVLKNGTDLKLIDEVFKLSDRYEAFRLYDKMADHMMTITITEENIELISRIADSSQNKQLIERVMTFINNDFNNILIKDDNELIQLNDSTHNNLLKVVFKNCRNFKSQRDMYMKSNQELSKRFSNHW